MGSGGRIVGRTVHVDGNQWKHETVIISTDMGEIHVRCWCGPTPLMVDDGLLVIHNDAIGVLLGLDPIHLA